MKTIKATFMSLALMVGSIALGQTTGFDNYTTNQDGVIDRNSFDQGYNNTYDQWDTNRDGYIEDREFYDVTYNRLDRDGDNNLSQEEWAEGHRNMYGDYLNNGNRANNQNQTNQQNQDNRNVANARDAENQGFQRFDTNRDGRLSNEEFYTGMGETEYFGTYDTNRDNRLDRDELNEGVFNNMDANRDGNIDRNEYDTYGSFYQDGTTSSRR